MSLRRRLSLPFWPSLLVLAMLVLTLNLGFWQLRREAEKQHLEAAREQAMAQPPQALDVALKAPNPLATRVVTNGHWLPAPLFRLASQNAEGRRGVHLLQWLRLPDERWLLVDRGWQPSEQIAEPAQGEMTVQGQLYAPGQPWRSPVLDAQAAVVDLPVLDLALLRQNKPERLPYLLRLEVGAAALQPNWSSTVGMTPAKHRGYAVTWFSLSAVLVLLYGWWLWQHRSVSPRKTSQHD